MRITGAGLRARREHLNLTRAQLGKILNISERVLGNWESGRENAPYNLADRLDAIEHDTKQHLYTLIAQHQPGDTIYTYRTEPDYRNHNPNSTYSASWHRGLCARLLDVIPNLTLKYHPAQTPDTAPSETNTNKT